MAQQTAVEFLLSELDIAKLIEREKLTMAAEVVRQAKAMEKKSYICSKCKCDLDEKDLLKMHDRKRTE
jgi:hypothetical protein